MILLLKLVCVVYLGFSLWTMLKILWEKFTPSEVPLSVYVRAVRRYQKIMELPTGQRMQAYEEWSNFMNSIPNSDKPPRSVD